MVVAAINDDFNSVFGHLVGGEKRQAGGLPYVSGTHLLGVQCFLACGNKYHDGEGDKAVTLQVFQNAIAKRHEMELQGHAYIKSEENDQDFQ